LSVALGWNAHTMKPNHGNGRAVRPLCQAVVRHPPLSNHWYSSRAGMETIFR
jgi:hypothetical protein